MTSAFSRRLAPLGVVVKELTGDMQLTKRELEETQVIFPSLLYVFSSLRMCQLSRGNSRRHVFLFLCCCFLLFPIFSLRTFDIFSGDLEK